RGPVGLGRLIPAATEAPAARPAPARRRPGRAATLLAAVGRARPAVAAAGVRWPSYSPLAERTRPASACCRGRPLELDRVAGRVPDVETQPLAARARSYAFLDDFHPCAARWPRSAASSHGPVARQK